LEGRHYRRLGDAPTFGIPRGQETDDIGAAVVARLLPALRGHASSRLGRTLLDTIELPRDRGFDR